MEKSYDPHRLEQHWYQYWEEQGYFSPDIADPDAEPFCVMIPPPNVTGVLHMGHAFQDTIMDTLTRYHRMCGRRALWQPGTDHAGIATQMVVERMINADNKTRHDYGRDKFIEKIWQWKEQSGGMITQQLRRMGASPDWQNERFTMDEGLSKAVTKVFVELYHEGIIYQGKRLVNWDPVLLTALSDLEVISEEEDGKLYHLRYPLSGSDKGGNGELGTDFLVVATTRPETMLGDCAVAVNPDDERYKHLIGQNINLPLTERTIPIIGDEHANPEFGSGCVKITPAHDFNDYQVWLRHRDNPLIQAQPNAGLINILTPNAAIIDDESDDDESSSTTDIIAEQYRGKDRFEARDAIIADLQQAQLVERIEDHKLMIPRGDRTGAVVEPYLTTQWYVDLTRETLTDGRPGGKAKITQPAIDVVRDGTVEFVPENWSKTYYQWLENIEDWCVSRQIWWGHRIPAWYDEHGNVFVGENEASVRAQNNLAQNIVLRQDEDVLDTWFSSALWPFSTLGWPEQTERLKTFYPTSVLVTGFDIIFFWVARMIMFGCKFAEDVPFHQVYIHGLIRDAHGQKMSKSKGNVLDPIDLIDGITLEALLEKRTQGMMQPHLKEKIIKQTREDFPQGIAGFGTDALRFTFAALASNGRDINFDLGRTEGYRNFCNKIWNAARFVLMHCENKNCGQNEQDLQPSDADKWMVSQLQRSTQTITDAIKKYRFDLASQEIYEVVRHKYCDWYLELCKATLNDDSASETAKISTRKTLVQTLETLMCLVHPMMPYISEEIWQKIASLSGKSGDTIMLQPYPQRQEDKIDPQAEAKIDWAMQFILGLRRIRGEMDISPAKPLPVMLSDAQPQDLQWLADTRTYLDIVGKAESITVLEEGESQPESAISMIGNMKILIPLSGLIEKEQELERLNKLLSQLDADLSRTEAKLSNQAFLDKAPAAVVNKEKEKIQTLKQQRQNIAEQIEKISQL